MEDVFHAPNGLRFSRVARTGDRSTYAEKAAGYVGCKRELDTAEIEAADTTTRAIHAV